jgi:hypothetical protein
MLAFCNVPRYGAYRLSAATQDEVGADLDINKRTIFPAVLPRSKEMPPFGQNILNIGIDTVAIVRNNIVNLQPCDILGCMSAYHKMPLASIFV